MDKYTRERNRMRRAKKDADSGSVSKQNMYANYCAYLGNYIEAIKYYKMAANQGDIDSFYELGLLYKLGKRVRRNFNKAYRYFKDALPSLRLDISEYAILHENLTFLNKKGIDIAELKKEAANGNVESIYKLGIAHEYAKGVRRNMNYAFDCYKVAAEKDHTLAQYRFGIWYYNYTNMDYSSETVQISRKFLTMAASKGHVYAAFALGGSYHLDDEEKSLYYFKIAADAEIPVACRMVGSKYEAIYTNTGNYGDLAIKYFVKGADLDEPTCLINVIRYYQSGYLVKQDEEKAKIYQKKLDKLRNNIGFYR